MKGFFQKHLRSLIAAAIALGCGIAAFHISKLACGLVVGAAVGTWAAVTLFKKEDAPPATGG